ncbi:MAG: hypothetical protein P8Y81_04240 [Ignavibacteriaceae bacterium]
MRNILLLILFLNVATYAQVVTVEDKATQNPLELVSVYNSDPNRALLTGSNGKVDIGKLDKSKPIIFRLIGYERIGLTFSQIKENNFIVSMEQTAISLDNVVVSSNRWEENTANYCGYARNVCKRVHPEKPAWRR